MDYVDILQKLGYKLRKNNKYCYSSNAEYRGGDNPTALSIDTEKECYYDFVQCEGGTLRKLIFLTIKNNPTLSQEVPLTELKNFILSHSITDNIDKEIRKPKIIMPKKFKNAYLQTLFPFYDFYRKKGFSIKTLERFQCGYDMAGPMYQRIVFPIFDHINGEIVGLSGRAVDNKRYPKWKNLGGKMHFVYPAFLNGLKLHNKPVVLVESIGDVLACFECGFENVLCTFGLTLSNKLLNYIIGLNPSKIFITLNSDEEKIVNGKKQKAGELGVGKVQDKLVKFFNKDKIVVLYPQKGYNDLCAHFENDRHGFTEWLKNYQTL